MTTQQLKIGFSLLPAFMKWTWQDGERRKTFIHVHILLAVLSVAYFFFGEWGLWGVMALLYTSYVWLEFRKFLRDRGMLKRKK